MARYKGAFAPRMLERTNISSSEITESERLIREAFNDSMVVELNEAEATFRIRDRKWLIENRDFATKGIVVQISKEPKPDQQD